MNPLRIFFAVFGLVGLISLVAFVAVSFFSLRKEMQWEQSSGQIVSLDQSGYPTISFDYNGRTYQFHENVRGTGVTVGKAVVVHFPAGQPDQAEEKSFFSLWFAPLLTGLFALIFGGVGGFGWSSILKRTRLKRELFEMQKGKKVAMPIGDVFYDTSFKYNGRSPYVIVGQFHDKTLNTVHEYRSEYIWYNPTSLLQGRTTVDVWIDPDDPKKYYMDITFLPKKI